MYKLIRPILYGILLCGVCSTGLSQGVVRGRVVDGLTQEPLPLAAVGVQGTGIGVATDTLGRYVLENLTPGVYNIEARYLGYESLIIYDIEVTTARVQTIDFELRGLAQELDEVEVSYKTSFLSTEESPLSVKTIGTNEIKRTPGGNRDVSSVVRVLPGVASTPSFRNDILVRGGAPSENAFFIDGIPIPVINHFQTQGSSGGPQGIINVDLVEEVRFYSSAFPASRGNAMSSVFDFKFKQTRPEKWNFNFVVGSSDLSVTTQGPVGEKGFFIGSLRRSYLDFVLPLLNLPFVPAYNDFQFKFKYKFSNKHQLTVLSIAALDDFRLNPGVIDNIEDKDDKDAARLTLANIPANGQWNYTVGAKYEYFADNSILSVVLSRNQLNNYADKYFNNDESNPDNLILDYNSGETENHLRAERYHVFDDWQLSYGLQYAYTTYSTSTYNIKPTPAGLDTLNYEGGIGFHRLGAFVQGSKTFFGRLLVSLGARVDDNTFLETDDRPSALRFLDQISPRLAASFTVVPRLKINANVGIYHQLPVYTTLGYRETITNQLLNTNVRYIRSTHAVVGFSYETATASQFSLEGFYKYYDRYPFLITNEIALANLGADFGVVGNDAVRSTATGRSYGLEASFQQKFYKGFYGIATYTLFKSEFIDKNNAYVPSSWDYRHLISATVSKRFNTTTSKRKPKNPLRKPIKANWEVGMRWLFTGKGPYTPTNPEETVLIKNFEAQPGGVPDFDLLNTERNPAYHQLDIRVERRWFFTRSSMSLFLDVRNAYSYKFKGEDTINVVRDEDGTPLVDPNNSDSYQLRLLPNENGFILPSIGFIFEF